MQTPTLSVETRSALGKKVGALRRAGITPIHVYGKAMESLSLQVASLALQRTLAAVGRTIPLTLQMDGAEHFVIVREVQRDPVTEQVLHVDFLQVSRTERMRVGVPLELEGEAPALRLEASTFVQNLHGVEVEALPMDVPPVLPVDISSLDEIGKAIHAGDIPLPAGVTLVSDLEALVARVVHQRIVVEEPEAVAEVEGEEAPAAEAEGEAAPDAKEKQEK